MSTKSEAKRVLFVDDDAVIAYVYRAKLLEAGYAVDVAEDGLIAVRILKAHRPDLVILDVMMPKFNGLAVLDYIRSCPELSGIKVIVLSNCYFDGHDRRVILTKADCGLVKSSCTPKKLIETAAALLAGHDPEARSPAASVSPVTALTTQAAKLDPAAASEPAVSARAREDFLRNTAKTMANLRQLSEAFNRAQDRRAQDTRLLEFYRKVHFVTALAGQAGCTRLALLLNAFEALLLELHEKPAHISASPLHTIGCTLDFLEGLFAQADEDTAAAGFHARALVVDDESISARAASSALHRAGFNVVTLQDPIAAVENLGKENFDLVLLDIVMPGLDGLELCQRIRALPRYQKTPIIFVTGHADFLNRAGTIRTGGNDVIAKPFLPMELAVKAITHWLRAKMPANAAPA